jgi:hypothetical protein
VNKLVDRKKDELRMTFLDAKNPQVKEALERIEALHELTRSTGVKTYRTVNEILASLPADVLTAVAVELKNRKELTSNVRTNR